ncbi:hypothetical protein OAV92_02670 [Crocinitomicaceae bacterium]|jgi:hypothetical protein|nr:hypothetical protein [Crocinitomicaceae bacterium]
MKIFSLFIFIFINVQCWSQLEDRYWIFGRTSADTPNNLTIDFYPEDGLIYASTLPPSMTVEPTGIGPDNGFEGWCVATSPNIGELKFYTDGRKVYNAEHTDISPMSINHD